MEINKALSQLSVGQEIEGFYILKSAQQRSTAAGKPFLNALLSDCSGEMEAKVWDYSGPVGEADAGSVIKIRGTVGEYRGNMQISVERIRAATDTDRYDLGLLVPTAPMDRDAAFEKVLSLVDSIEDSDYHNICREMLRRHEKDFRSIPAAKSVHHGFISGLLMHTVNMMKTADFLAGLYRDTVDRSLLLAGTMLHDFAKIEEFSLSRLGLVKEYSVKGQLLGHLVMGAQEVKELAELLGVSEEKNVLLQHMILSHHGEPEYGAAVRPMCAESELLSYIDLIDSRMEIYREELEKLDTGTFSPFIHAVDKRIYKHE